MKSTPEGPGSNPCATERCSGALSLAPRTQYPSGLHTCLRGLAWRLPRHPELGGPSLLLGLEVDPVVGLDAAGFGGVVAVVEPGRRVADDRGLELPVTVRTGQDRWRRLP